jgi:hypothetical protein
MRLHSEDQVPRTSRLKIIRVSTVVIYSGHRATGPNILFSVVFTPSPLQPPRQCFGPILVISLL